MRGLYCFNDVNLFLRERELYWTHPGERVGRSKWKLSLKRGAIAWARTAAAHSPLYFEGSPKRRPLA